MLTVKRITIYLLAIIVPVSLFIGSFCYAMPQTGQTTAVAGQAAEMPAAGNMAECGGMDQTEHFMAPDDSAADSVALCCVAKKDNSEAGILALNERLPNEAASQLNISIEDIGTDNFNHQLVLCDYPISPPQVDLLATVIKIE